MSFKSWFGKTMLKLKGWKMVGEIPEDIKKSVTIAAPHTSIEDFFIGRYYYWYIERPVRFLVKKEFFKPDCLGWLLRKLGGIPVDRSRASNVVSSVVEQFGKYDELNVVITPEGTRKRTEHWKKGFYYIALKANVPIIVGFMDFGNKICGTGPLIYPSGDFDADFKIIEDFYRGMKGKYPERFNL